MPWRNPALRIFRTDQFELPLPPGHRFPVSKYRLLRERVEAAGLAGPGGLDVAPAAGDSDLARVHTADYLQALRDGTLDREAQRRLGLPWSPALVERSRRSAGATLAAAAAALDDGIAVSLAGGTHHAFPGYGSGYCVFNDCAVAVRALQARGAIARALVVDCDVHQGDGTAAIFEGDPAVYTLSLHGARNFPFRKQRSTLDVELADGTGDAEYLAALDAALAQALPVAAPDLVLYLAGADPFEGDRLGRLALTKDGLHKRDLRVLAACAGAHIPVAVLMAGGYAEPIEDTVDIHYATVLAARSFA